MKPIKTMNCLPLNELQRQTHLHRVLYVTDVVEGKGIGKCSNRGGDVVINDDLVHTDLQVLVTLNGYIYIYKKRKSPIRHPKGWAATLP